jgi:hypothetical protein
MQLIGRKTIPVQNVVIAAGAALSDAVDIRNFASFGWAINGSWTAASLAFQVSIDGVTFFPLQTAAGALIEHAMTTTPNAGRSLPVEALPFSFVKLWSETAGASVNQAGARTFSIGVKG